MFFDFFMFKKSQRTLYDYIIHLMSILMHCSQFYQKCPAKGKPEFGIYLHSIHWLQEVGFYFAPIFKAVN